MKLYVVTSGIAYLTEKGTSISSADAKYFDCYHDALVALLESDLDDYYWYVKVI